MAGNHDVLRQGTFAILDFSEPIGEEQAWSTQRMEYVFSIAAPTEPETVLACEYQQGDLDWYDFDVQPEAAIGAAADRQPGVAPRQGARHVGCR